MRCSLYALYRYTRTVCSPSFLNLMPLLFVNLSSSLNCRSFSHSEEMNTSNERRITAPSTTFRRIVTQAAVDMLADRLAPGYRRSFYDANGDSPMDPFINENSGFGGIVPLLWRMIKLILISTVLLVLSGSSYSLLYKQLMPPRFATEPLHFDYSLAAQSASLQVHASRGIFRSVHPSSDEFMHPDTLLPAATVDLFSKHNSWQANVHDVEPVPIATERLLDADQEYYIDVLFHLPESDINRQAGVFVVQTELRGAINQVSLATSRRASRLPHESHWISIIRKLFWLPAFLVGAVEESRTVSVSAYRHFVECQKFPLRYVHVSIIRHSLSQPNVEIISGELHIGKEMNAFQEFLKEWYFSCFFLGTLCFAAFYLMVSILACALVESLRHRYFEWQEPPCELDFGDDGDLFNDNDRRHRSDDDQSSLPAPEFQAESPSSRTTDENFQDAHSNDHRHGVRWRGTAESAMPVVESQGSWEDLYYPAQGTTGYNDAFEIDASSAS